VVSKPGMVAWERWGGMVLLWKVTLKVCLYCKKRLSVSHFFELPQKFCFGVRCVGRSNGYYDILLYVKSF
jgi:hypothetical protein